VKQRTVNYPGVVETGGVLGIELGSTNIKAVLIGPDAEVLATGSAAWENQLGPDRLWTYSLDDVWAGIQSAVARMRDDAAAKHGVRPKAFAAIGISAMMHGYLAFDAAGQLLVPFRTWRNTNTGEAAAELTDKLGFAFPLRWSASHYYQAILDGEPHVPEVDFLTTLAGYVHWQLTGQKVLGVGDASGMFPIDANTHGYDAARLAKFDELVGDRGPKPLAELLPTPLDAGADAGHLTEAGALLLDPTGTIAPGALACPPEGDAGTGMVATNSVAPRTGNVSAGTSIFAMVVLDHPLANLHPELDIVTTPSGAPVAMVHCNNGSSELGAWASMFGEFATALTGEPVPADDVYAALFSAALAGESDGGGLLAYNYLAGEPITGLETGCPVVVRTPDSQMTLANFARSQLYGVFGTLSLGMEILRNENVALDSMFAHGGLFKTAGVAQRFLAAALGVPVAVGQTASEGGAWGIAVLALYALAKAHGSPLTLDRFLADQVFADAAPTVLAPEPDDLRGYREYLRRYEVGLPVVAAATKALTD